MSTLYNRWWDALATDRCTWHCGKARDDICRCRCGGKYHGVYHDHLMSLPINQGRYAVTVCAHCRHPAGCHVTGRSNAEQIGCRLCEPCPGYEDGFETSWNDEQTRRLNGGKLLHESPSPPWITMRRAALLTA